jgi:hypothetical protein
MHQTPEGRRSTARAIVLLVSWWIVFGDPSQWQNGKWTHVVDDPIPGQKHETLHGVKRKPAHLLRGGFHFSVIERQDGTCFHSAVRALPCL